MHTYVFLYMHTTGLRRNASDKFYTSASLAEHCVSLAATRLNITVDDLLVEPSAGEGVFIPYLRALSPHTQFFDIAPMHPDIVQADYLNLAEPITHADLIRGNKIHVIGNPPFGRQSSLAVRFIQKSCEFCDSVSFILPRSFKKASLRNRVPLCFRLDAEYDIPPDSFTIDGNPHSVKCVFQIWVRDTQLRIIPRELEPINFQFVKTADLAQAAVRRVGALAGQIFGAAAALTKCAQSHYFIIFVNGKAPEANILRLAESIHLFKHDNTVGPRSISRQELVAIYDTLL